MWRVAGASEGERGGEGMSGVSGTGGGDAKPDESERESSCDPSPCRSSVIERERERVCVCV